MNKNYLDNLQNVNLLNAGFDKRVPEELKKLSNNYFSRKYGVSVLSRYSIMDYLKGEIEVDYIESNIKYEGRNKEFVSELQETLNEYYSYFYKNKPYIGEKRLLNGFNNGLIDFISGALIKKEDGWYNEQGLKKFDNKSEFDEIKKNIGLKCNIVPEYSIKDLLKIEEMGEYYVSGKKVAELIEENGRKYWLDIERNKAFAENDLIRLLHHRNDIVILGNNNISDTYYHASLSNEIKNRENLIAREGLSAQGTAIYGTGSLNEAIKVYGNPYSFESKSKYHALKNNGIDISDYNIGHLYKVNSNGNVYRASINDSASIYEMPSLPLLLCLSEDKINKEYIHSMWLRMKDSVSTYELYQHINEFSETAQKNYGVENIFKKIFLSMNFDTVEIIFPEQLLNNIENKIKEIEESDIENKERIIKQIKIIQGELLESVPAKAEKSHLIIYDTNNVVSRYLGRLISSEEPKFDEKYNVIKKGIYWSDNKIEESELDKLLVKENKILLKNKKAP